MKHPIHRSLIRPKLMLGMPRNVGICLIMTTLMIGWQFGHWIAATVIFAVVWSVFAVIAQYDYRLPQLWWRALFSRTPSDHLRK